MLAKGPARSFCDELRKAGQWGSEVVPDKTSNRKVAQGSQRDPPEEQTEQI